MNETPKGLVTLCSMLGPRVGTLGAAAMPAATEHRPRPPPPATSGSPPAARQKKSAQAKNR